MNYTILVGKASEKAFWNLYAPFLSFVFIQILLVLSLYQFVTDNCDQRNRNTGKWSVCT